MHYIIILSIQLGSAGNFHLIGLEQSNAYDNGPKTIYVDRQSCEKELMIGLRKSKQKWLVEPTEIGIFGRWRDDSYGNGLVLTKHCVEIGSIQVFGQ